MRSILILMLLLAATPLYAAQIVVALNPADSAHIRRALSDTAALAPRFHRITLALPADRKPDSAAILSQYPFLRGPLYRIQWSQNLIPAALRSPQSTIYRFDRKGELLASTALSDFDPASFAGSLEPYSIAAIDTLRTANRMPASVSNLIVAGGRLYVIDDETEQLVYLDQRNGDTLWNTIAFDAQAPAAYQRHLRLSDSETARLIRGYDSVFRAEGHGSLASVASLSSRADTLLVTVTHNYPTEFTLANFKEVYEVVDDRIVARALVIMPEATYTDSVDRVATELYRSRLSGSDSLLHLPQFAAFIDQAARAYRLKHPLQYISTSQIFKNDTGAYLVRSTQNRNSFRFMGVFCKSDGELRPTERMLMVEKGEIYKRSGNYRISSALRGRYPWLMDPSSNVLYDLERDTETVLPLDLGDYDFSEAAMRQLRPRTELFVYDVFVEDGIARVLYVTKNQLWPRLLVYDLSRRSILSDEALYSLSLKGHCQLKFADAGSFFVTHADGGTLQLVSLN